MDNFLASFEETQAEELKRVGDLQMQARNMISQADHEFCHLDHLYFMCCKISDSTDDRGDEPDAVAGGALADGRGVLGHEGRPLLQAGKSGIVEMKISFKIPNNN